MTLYKKTLVAVVTTLIGVFALLFATARVIMINSYQQIEARGVSTNTQRACSALDDDLNSFKSSALGWSKWDDTYQFVDDKNQTFIDKNLSDETFKDSDVNLMVFLNKHDELVYAKSFDLVTNRAVPLSTSFIEHLKADDLLVMHNNLSSFHQGILSLPEGYLMTVSLPILNSAGDGPINGTLIWGRFLNAARMTHFSEMLRFDMTLRPYDQATLSRATLIEQDATPPSFPPINYYSAPLSQDQIAGYTTIFDIYDKPTALLYVKLPRTIYAQGQATLSYFLGALAIIGFVFIVLTVIMLERNVLSRLSSLSRQVSHIRKTSDLKTRINIAGTDELSSLGFDLQSMLDALDESRMQLQAANAQLQTANDHLEQRVAARTADLTDAIELLRLEVAERRQTQELLAQAHDQALEALRMKTQILSNVSHDARTPLTSIMLHSELLQRGTYGSITEKQNQRLESILLSARQLLGFINNLLGEAQLSSGNLRLHMAPLSPGQLLREISLVVIPLAERKELKMLVDIAPDVPSTIMGDADRLKQVITNLCDNAIKFTAAGQISLYLAKTASNNLVLTVKDTGRGIPADLLPRIFDAFWQVDGSSTRDVNRGVGLGLSIVKQLVTAMNGVIAVDSELGKGTTFTVQLPLLPEAEPAPSTLA